MRLLPTLWFVRQTGCLFLGWQKDGAPTCPLGDDLVCSNRRTTDPAWHPYVWGFDRTNNTRMVYVDGTLACANANNAAFPYSPVTNAISPGLPLANSNTFRG